MAAPSPFQQLLNLLPKQLRNKYLLVSAVFLALMVFVDKHDLWTQYKLKNSVNELESDKAYFEKEIEQAKQDRQDIETNKEQFAREKYQMHKSDEEVFIIQKEE